MKRFLVVICSLLLSGFFVGCGSDTHEDLIKNTIKMIDIAAVDVSNIKGRVDDAVKRADEAKKNSIDLSEAIKATEKLKETGDEAQKLKRRIEQVRSQITDVERKEYAKSQKDQLNAAFTDLLKKRAELRTAIADAEKRFSGTKVKELRDKIIEAEAPFEALAK